VGFRQKKINGIGVIEPNTGYPIRNDSKEILGEGIHPYFGGINNTLSFKGFHFGFLIDFKFGGSIYSGTNRQMTRSGIHKQTLEGREEGLVSTGVNESGQEISVTIPRDSLQYYWKEYTSISENFIYDASYVKLRQVIFGYNFPSRLLRKTPFTALNLSLVGRNLALLYSQTENVDPESFYNTSNYRGLEMFTVPATRTYGFNLSVKF
jgi:hypothetical protein